MSRAPRSSSSARRAPRSRPRGHRREQAPRRRRAFRCRPGRPARAAPRAEDRHDLGDGPDQVSQVGLLPHRVIDHQPDRALFKSTGFRRPADRTADRRVVKRLAPVPGPALVPRLELEVPTRQIISYRVTPDEVPGLLLADIEPGLADRDHEFALMMEVGCQRRIAHRAIVDDGVRRLGEEERRLAGRIFPHLARVSLVVAPHAEDAAHGKARRDAVNGDARNRLGWENTVGIVQTRVDPGGAWFRVIWLAWRQGGWTRCRASPGDDSIRRASTSAGHSRAPSLSRRRGGR